MATSLTREQLRQKPITPYATIRDQLQTGDLIFCSGDMLASKLISSGTHSAFSHIGMIVKFDEIDRVYMLESVESGVRFAPLSKYLGTNRQKGYNGALAAAKMNDLTTGQRLDLAKHGGDMLTQPYGFLNVLLFTCYVWFGFVFKRVKGQYMCSDLIEACFQKIGIATFAHEPGQHISPENIWQSPRVAFLARIR